eukprot:83520_1
MLALSIFFFLVYTAIAYDWCPQYHLIRAKNVYDPSGPIYYNNTWHVFEDSCAWCHYYSPDLIHWQSLPKTGFTGLTGSIGTITTQNNPPTFVAFYPKGDQTGINRAISTDNMLQKWTTTGTVINRPTNIGGSTNFRDPLRPIEINGNLYIGVGSGVNPNGPGMVLWYKSTKSDMSEWQPLGSLFNVSKTYGCIDSKTIIYNSNASKAINAIECPDVFLMEDKYVLITGLFCTNEYWVGNIDTTSNTFNPLSDHNHALLDYGNFYAAKTGTVYNGVNGETRRILFGFSGWSEPTAPSACGRSHVIPRDIRLNNKNLLTFNPIKEIKNIRGDSNNVKIGSELQVILDCQLINNGLPNTGNVSVNVLVSSDGSEFVQIGYMFDNNGVFYVDHRKCCGDGNKIVQNVAFDSKEVLNEGGLYFNILLDRSIIESFFNQQKVITAMVNPSNSTAPEQRGIAVNNNLDTYFTCALQSWQLTL